jgi:hypothetical protein
LYNNRYIRNFLAVLLLAIFALSNTPTKFLHTLFANHTDFVSNSFNNSGNPELSVTGINCHCDNLVVISPYTTVNTILSQIIVRSFPDYSIAKSTHIPVSQKIFFDLKGPPSLV